MRSIEIAEALENGAKGSAIDLNNGHNVPILKSDCANAVLECPHWSHTRHFDR